MQTGRCPLPQGLCTDVTGRHHSTIVSAGSAEVAAAALEGWQIPGIEECPQG